MLISVLLTIPVISSETQSSLFNTYSISPSHIAAIIIAFLSFLFVFEYLEYREHEDTLLMHLFENDWTPILSIIIASFFTSILMEALNLPFRIWQYTNWPFQSITFLGIPIAIIIAWLIQYPLLISAYHSMYRKETRRIWDD
jgi:hypothetical protein